MVKLELHASVSPNCLLLGYISIFYHFSIHLVIYMSIWDLVAFIFMASFMDQARFPYKICVDDNLFSVLEPRNV